MQIRTILRIAAFAGVFVCNIAMWHCFVRSLHDSNSVAAATLNSCLNLIFTVRQTLALVGWHVIFEKKKPLILGGVQRVGVW